MFNKGIKRLFVKDGVKSNSLRYEMEKRKKKYSSYNVVYEYTYQEKLDGIIPCNCGEKQGEYRTFSEVHTKSDHVDGRCLKCAERENWNECFNYRIHSDVKIVYTESDILEHTNVKDMVGKNEGKIECICSNSFHIGNNSSKYLDPYGKKNCCKLTIYTFLNEHQKYLDNKKKQEWESKHGKFKHED